MNFIVETDYKNIQCYLQYEFVTHIIIKSDSLDSLFHYKLKFQYRNVKFIYYHQDFELEHEIGIIKKITDYGFDGVYFNNSSSNISIKRLWKMFKMLPNEYNYDWQIILDKDSHKIILEDSSTNYFIKDRLPTENEINIFNNVEINKKNNLLSYPSSSIIKGINFNK